MLLNKVEVLINTFIVTEEAFFHFSYYFPFEYLVSLFLLLYVPEYMLDCLCVCSYERETECVCTVYCTCIIKLYVNTLPHAHGLLIKPVQKRQRIDLFGINL